MNTITNVSIVSDHSGESPIITYSNPVITVIKQTPPTPKFTRIFYRLPCNCCCCRCNCICGFHNGYNVCCRCNCYC